MIKYMPPGTVRVYLKDGDWVEFDKVTGCWVTPNQIPILVISIENEELTVCYPMDQISHWLVGKLEDKEPLKMEAKL